VSMSGLSDGHSATGRMYGTHGSAVSEGAYLIRFLSLMPITLLHVTAVRATAQ
jgi:hypothetical protein